jgi:hypothetical protein
MGRDVLWAEQRSFVERFESDRYLRLKARLAERCGSEVRFRIAEMPCFFDEELLSEAALLGRELVDGLLGRPGYLREARGKIPSRHLCGNEADRPLFVQADFGLIRDDGGVLQWRLVEIQGFPSLYAFQPALAEAYVDTYDLGGEFRWLCGRKGSDAHASMLRRAIVGNHDPENVVLLELNPSLQKTLPDFLVTEKMLGVRTVCMTRVIRSGRRLYYDFGGRTIPIERFYNRVIVDELDRTGVSVPFLFSDDLEVEWAGHPNWYFLLSKFSIPFLDHACVPRSWILSEVDDLPGDPENLVLKPLFSFAGLGVQVGIRREDIERVPVEQRCNYLLQERMRFEPLIETPFGRSQVEVRVMYVDGEPVTYILRTGRGKMMGVDQNRDLEWVGASAALFR